MLKEAQHNQTVSHLRDGVAWKSQCLLLADWTPTCGCSQAGFGKWRSVLLIPCLHPCYHGRFVHEPIR